MDETNMKNTGQWNSDLIVIWAACFFFPLIICCIGKVVGFILSLKSNSTFVVLPESTMEREEEPDMFYELNTTVTLAEPTLELTPEPKTLTREEQWKVIEDATMERAMAGDKAARDWVTKHVFTDPVDPSVSQSDFLQDVVDALRPMGYKAADIKATVNELTRSKEYTSVDELIQDVIKSS
jgi:hypothetical protein